MNREIQQLRAIEAIAAGRLEEATAILLVLREGPRPVQRGVCRYCSCSEARGCAILIIEPDHAGAGYLIEPSVTRCGWADPEATVCTNVSCLEAWRRDSPAELDVDVHDLVAAAAPHSRIVRP